MYNHCVLIYLPLNRRRRRFAHECDDYFTIMLSVACAHEFASTIWLTSFEMEYAEKEPRKSISIHLLRKCIVLKSFVFGISSVKLHFILFNYGIPFEFVLIANISLLNIDQIMSWKHFHIESYGFWVSISARRQNKWIISSLPLGIHATNFPFEKRRR